MSYTEVELANLEIVKKVYENVLGKLDKTQVDEFFHEEYIQHNPMAQTGSIGLKNFLDWAKANSTSGEHRVKRLFADGDHVIAHVHVIINIGDRGMNVIDIFRLKDRKIIEHWDAAQEIPETIAHENGIF